MVLVAMFTLLALFSIISILMSADDPPARERSARQSRPLVGARPPVGAAHSLLHDAPAPAGAFVIRRGDSPARRPWQRGARPYNAGSARPTWSPRSPMPQPCARSARHPRRASDRGPGRASGGAGEQVGELWLAGPDSLVATEDGRPHPRRPRRRSWARRSSAAAAWPSWAPLPAAREAHRCRRLALAPGPPGRRARPRPVRSRSRRQDRGVARDRRRSGRAARDGTRDRLDEEALRAAIAAGTASHRHCHRRPAVPGETLLIRAGTLHAIGAGAFVYEIEQPSDLTFRISDWGGRPAGPSTWPRRCGPSARRSTRSRPDPGSGWTGARSRCRSSAWSCRTWRRRSIDTPAVDRARSSRRSGHAPARRRRLVGDARAVRDAGGPGGRRCLRDRPARGRDRCVGSLPRGRVADSPGAAGPAGAPRSVPTPTRSRRPGGAAPRGSRPGRAPPGRSPRRDRRRRRDACPPAGPAGPPPRGRS